MTFEEFDAHQKEFIIEILALNNTKGKEYARDNNDRFANFNRIAIDLQLSRLQVAFVYLTKHLDGIKSFVKDGKVYSDEKIRGRFKDAIVYLMLMEGMVAEDELKSQQAGRNPVDLRQTQNTYNKMNEGFKVE